MARFIRPTNKGIATILLKRKVTEEEWTDLRKANGDKDAARIMKTKHGHVISYPWLLIDYFSVKA